MVFWNSPVLYPSPKFLVSSNHFTLEFCIFQNVGCWNHVLWYSLMDGLLWFGNIHLTRIHPCLLMASQGISFHSWAILHCLSVSLSPLSYGGWWEKLLWVLVHSCLCARFSLSWMLIENAAAGSHTEMAIRLCEKLIQYPAAFGSHWCSWMLTTNAIFYSAVPQWQVIRASLESTFALTVSSWCFQSLCSF